MSKFILILLCVFSFTKLYAQSSGEFVFNVLNTPFSPRMAVLNQPIAIVDKDVNVGVLNPSVLNDEMHHQISMNFVDYFSDINFVEAVYAFPIKDFGTLSTSFKNVSYGQFIQTDFSANQQGTFSASEQLITIGCGKLILPKIRLGTNVKMVLSSLESYNSVALASDIAISYFDEKSTWSFSFLARNIGRQVNQYTSISETIPFTLDFGASKKLEHLPFKFTIGYNNLNRFDLTYSGLYETEIEESNAMGFGNKLFSHFEFGGELTIAKRVDLRFGYNALKRNELKVNSYLGTVGFSWGMGVQLNSFRIDFGRSTYHLHGSPNYFSVSSNLNQFLSKR